MMMTRITTRAVVIRGRENPAAPLSVAVAGQGLAKPKTLQIRDGAADRAKQTKGES